MSVTVQVPNSSFVKAAVASTVIVKQLDLIKSNAEPVDEAMRRDQADKPGDTENDSDRARADERV